MGDVGAGEAREGAAHNLDSRALAPQDVLWGLWRAQEHSLLDMSVFDSQEYEVRLAVVATGKA